MAKSYIQNCPVRAAIVALAAVAILLVSPSDSFAGFGPIGEGVFGGFNLGGAKGNFDLDTVDSNPDTGQIGGFHVGYRTVRGVGFSLGVSEAYFGYSRVLDEGEVAAEYALEMLDLSVWLFAPIGRVLEVHARGGLGLTTVQARESIFRSDASSSGVLLSGGGAIRVAGPLVIYSDLSYRSYGVAFTRFDVDDELTAIGFSLGIGWRPEPRRTRRIRVRPR
jgi:hypothetical protein